MCGKISANLYADTTPDISDIANEFKKVANRSRYVPGVFHGALSDEASKWYEDNISDTYEEAYESPHVRGLLYAFAAAVAVAQAKDSA